MDTSSAFWQAVRVNHRLQRQATVIQPASRLGPIPLTYGQERLWWMEQLQPGALAHNLRAVFRLEGQLNLTALERSLAEIVRRHEILRTTFHPLEGRPVQVIATDLTLPLPVADLSQLPPAQREAEAQRLATAEAQRPFDLTRGPLLRLRLLRMAEEEHILVRTVHHIINDRWSDSVFMGELARLYGAFVGGKPSPLPDLPIQYADFALDQRQRMPGEALAVQVDYWRRQLAGQPAPLQLPVDRTALAAPAYQGDTQYITLTPELTQALQGAAIQAGVSLFVVLLAAFKILLYQYSGQEEIILCTPVAGRNRPETKKLIGYFSNLLLLRTSLQGNPSLRELLHRVSQVTLGAFEHQDMPLQQTAEALNLPGVLLAQAMFALQNVPSQPRTMAGLSLSPVDIPEGISNFDLSLSMRLRDAGLWGALRYKTGLFQAATIARLLANFQDLLQTLAAGPGLHLAALPRFSAPKTACGAFHGGAGAIAAEGVYVAPRSTLERTIAGIWQELLQRDSISVEANFFELGGRSLAMVQLCCRLQIALNQEIPVRELFTHPTVRSMAAYSSQQNEPKSNAAPSIQDRAKKQQAALNRQKERLKLRRQLK